MIGALVGIFSNTKLVYGFDTFARADSATLGTSDNGHVWSNISGTFGIVANKAKGTGNNILCVAAIDAGVTDYDISADITWYTGDVVALAGRIQNSSNFMRLRIDGATLKIDKVISGTSTTLATYNYVLTNGATLKFVFRCKGNDFSAYLNGTVMLTATNDNTTKTYTKVGITAQKTSAVPAATFKNFLVRQI